VLPVCASDCCTAGAGASVEVCARAICGLAANNIIVAEHAAEIAPRHTIELLIFMTPPVNRLTCLLALLVAVAIRPKLGTPCLRENFLGNGCPIREPFHLGFCGSRAGD